jgi:hypothetical protein
LGPKGLPWLYTSAQGQGYTGLHWERVVQANCPVAVFHNLRKYKSPSKEKSVEKVLSKFSLGIEISYFPIIDYLHKKVGRVI